MGYFFYKWHELGVCKCGDCKKYFFIKKNPKTREWEGEEISKEKLLLLHSLHGKGGMIEELWSYPKY